MRDHRATESLLQRLFQVILALGGDIEPAIGVGEAPCAQDAFFSGPGEAPWPIADDMDRELLRFRVQLLAEIAGRPSAGLLPVGDYDDDSRLVLVVENLGPPASSR